MHSKVETNPAIAVIRDGERLDVVCLRDPYLVHYFPSVYKQPG